MERIIKKVNELIEKISPEYRADAFHLFLDHELLTIRAQQRFDEKRR
jgi:hypothetical protein